MDYPLGHRLRELPGPLLLTGHTGFKGAWMTFLLEHLNVPVVGYSLPPEKDSLYERAERTGAIPEALADIRDYETLEQFIDLHKPSTIIHMAAQPLVLKSYENPRETFDVNVMGTVNLLDIAFKKDFIKAIIIVTTDKVYRNDNAGRAFVETDPLEGKDPYSASKVGAESVVAAWQQIAKVSGGPKVVSVRAGNVIGGGDYAENRILPDLVRGMISGDQVSLRNPSSTRPWQHVLDPSVGYLLALEKSLTGHNLPVYNFGPIGENLTVGEVAQVVKSIFPQLQLNLDSGRLLQDQESINLNLNTELSVQNLNWHPIFNQKESIEMSFSWWIRLLRNNSSIRDLCFEDINKFFMCNP